MIRSVRAGSSGAGITLLALVVVALLAVAASVSPLLPFVAIGGIALIALAAFRPVEVICLGILVVPLEGFFAGTLVGPSQAVLGAAAVGWLLRWGATTPHELPSHPALAGFALLIVANAAGLIFAPEPLVVARQVTTWGTMLIVAAAIVHSGGEAARTKVLLALAVTGGLAGVVAIIDPRPLTAVVFEGGDVTRATGGLGSPNALGMLLVLTIPIQVVYTLAGNRLTRPIGAVCLGIALLAMTLAVSRGAFIGLGGALLVLAWWRPFRRTVLVAVPLVLVLAFVGNNPASQFFGGGAVLQRLTEVRSTGAENPRLVLWRAAPQMIEDRPLFGMGGLEYGHYAASYDVVLTEGVPNHAHNLLLTIVIESGVVGLIGLLAMFATLALALFRAATVRTADPPATPLETGLVVALLAALVGFLFNGMFDYALGAAPIAAVFFSAVGCAAAISGRPTPVRSPASSRQRRPLFVPTAAPARKGV